jgi:addiction module RelE/StbE family toxin
MRFDFAAAAIEEIDEALAYYQAIYPDLSSRLVQELEDSLQMILRFPLGGHPLEGGLRQRRIKSFPYVIVYQPRDDAIVIIAFANTHRRPGYWRDRVYPT